MARVEVTTWYLEMLRPAQLRAAEAPEGMDLRLEQARVASPEFSRFLYTAVGGGGWYWIERLGWDYQRWLEYLNRPQVETHVLYVSGTPAGYVELEHQADDNVEVAYFGLLPKFIGQKLGGFLLSSGVQRAWLRGARRVWVHTCSLDGPNALANYRARGFEVYDTNKEVMDLPAESPGPWPEAGRIATPV